MPRKRASSRTGRSTSGRSPGTDAEQSSGGRLAGEPVVGDSPGRARRSARRPRPPAPWPQPRRARRSASSVTEGLLPPRAACSVCRAAASATCAAASARVAARASFFAASYCERRSSISASQSSMSPPPFGWIGSFGALPLGGCGLERLSWAISLASWSSSPDALDSLCCAEEDAAVCAADCGFERRDRRRGVERVELGLARPDLAVELAPRWQGSSRGRRRPPRSGRARRVGGARARRPPSRARAGRRGRA